MHTTNYYNTFIEVAEDCPADVSEVPPLKGQEKTVANIQFEMVSKNPYKYTSDDVLFTVFASKKDLVESEMESARAQFFSKGQPCFRASPLPKRYGWGVHSNEEGKIALVALNSDDYSDFLKNDKVKKLKAMRSKKA